MNAIVLFLPAIAGAADPQATAFDGPGARYQTGKDLAALEKCLTDRLSGLGEVTAISIQGTKTLVLQVEGERPMLIDLVPPEVTVTTKFIFGSRRLVKACV